MCLVFLFICNFFLRYIFQSVVPVDPLAFLAFVFCIGLQKIYTDDQEAKVIMEVKVISLNPAISEILRDSRQKKCRRHFSSQ